VNDAQDMTDSDLTTTEEPSEAQTPEPADDAAGLPAPDGPDAPLSATAPAATEESPEAQTPVDDRPALEPADAAADAALAEAVVGGLTWVPFALYLGCWIALSGASVYVLGQATPENPARWMPVYPSLVITGVALAAVGPAMSLAVWLVARSRRPAERRRGLLASALTRGALAAFFGAMVWIVTLYVLEVVSGSAAW